MEGYKRSFLLPITQGTARNELEANVVLVVVLFMQAAEGNDDAMSIERANLQLLKSYKKEFGAELVQFYQYDVKKFSRGGGDFDFYSIGRGILSGCCCVLKLCFAAAVVVNRYFFFEEPYLPQRKRLQQSVTFETEANLELCKY